MTVGEVQDVLGTDYGSNKLPALTRAIAAATSLMARVAACAVSAGIPLTGDEQTNIGIYLAAHVYTVSDRLYTSRSTAGVSGSWSMPGLAKGLESTPYGVMAINMDPSGCLMSQSLRAVASGFSCGPDDVS